MKTNVNIINRQRIIDFINLCIWNLYSRPKGVAKYLLKRPKSRNQSTYYPNLPRKSNFRIWLDQLIQCYKYGCPNDFYFPYGFDVKNSNEMNEYLHYLPFMKLRDARNVSAHSATVILRDKLYFGFFTQALGVDSGKNLGITKSEKTFDCIEKKYYNTASFLQKLNGQYIFKPIEGECGGGIFIINFINNKYISTN